MSKVAVAGYTPNDCDYVISTLLFSVPSSSSWVEGYYSSRYANTIENERSTSQLYQLSTPSASQASFFIDSRSVRTIIAHVLDICSRLGVGVVTTTVVLHL